MLQSIYNRQIGLAQQIAELERRQEEIKNIQYLGRDVITPQVSIVNDDVYDFTISKTPTAWYISFNADIQTSPYGRLIFAVYTDSGGTTFLPDADLIISTQFIDFTSIETDGLLKWLTTPYIDSGSSYSIAYIKLYVLATDNGEVTFESV